MLRHGYCVSAAIVGNFDAEFAERHLVQVVSPRAGGLNKAQVRDLGRNIRRDRSPAEQHRDGVLHLCGRVIDGLSGVHPGDFYVLGCDFLVCLQLRFVRSVKNYFGTHRLS